jgi:hypothetical protein
MSTPPLQAQTDKITLDVGERRFVTTTSTLIEQSGFFSSLLSGRWDNKETRNSYYLDMDGDVFAHVLRYLRNQVFPVFYDKLKGHDYGLYAMVFEQARYLQIPRLEKWLQERTYLKAVTVTHSIREVEFAQIIPTKTNSNIDVEYHSEYARRKIYLCPRNIHSHRGNPQRCGRACANAGRDSEPEYEDEGYFNMLVIERETEFNKEICME